ncbi:MAG: hypothetical protein COA78_15815 [Blastopirellula sp.]|nr:MAG: hypothetical protein COA78_15815 [Blastopirellula sp.]
MSSKIPNTVIGAVAAVIGDNYSHSKLNTLFMESGAPGNEPEGNRVDKCSSWLKRCNNDKSIDALEVLGAVIQEYMAQEPSSVFNGTVSSKITAGQERIQKALGKNQLSYRTNGYITLAGSRPISKTLEDYLKSGDFSSIEKEFERAVEHINSDPHASITAACSIIEAALKFYIETFINSDMPSSLNVKNLWKVVQDHLKLNDDPILADDQHRVLKGISSIIDGVGAFRSHIGSAHGRGSNPPSIVVAEARLVVNAAHTIVVFVMEVLHAQKT